MDDSDREPPVSDEEIRSVFARINDTNLMTREFADELPIRHDVLETERMGRDAILPVWST